MEKAAPVKVRDIIRIERAGENVHVIYETDEAPLILEMPIGVLRDTAAMSRPMTEFK